MREPVEHIREERQRLESILVDQRRLKQLLGGLMVFPNVRIEYYGGEILPPDQPVVVIGTHQNSHDAPALCYAYNDRTDLPLSMVEKIELDQIPLAGAYLRSVGGLPFHRETADTAQQRAQIKMAKLRLEAGGSVGIMAEGSRKHGGTIGPLKRGFSLIAKRAGVEIVTAGIYGESPRSGIMPEKLWPFIPRPLTVYFGSRTSPAEIDDPEEFYRRQLQSDYDTALAIHHGRPLPASPQAG